MHEAQQLVGCVQMVVLDTKRIADSAHWEGVFCHEPGGSPMRVPNWGLTSMPATNAASRELVRPVPRCPSLPRAVTALWWLPWQQLQHG